MTDGKGSLDSRLPGPAFRTKSWDSAPEPAGPANKLLFLSQWTALERSREGKTRPRRKGGVSPRLSPVGFSVHQQEGAVAVCINTEMFFRPPGVLPRACDCGWEEAAPRGGRGVDFPPWGLRRVLLLCVCPIHSMSRCYCQTAAAVLRNKICPEISRIFLLHSFCSLCSNPTGLNPLSSTLTFQLWSWPTLAPVGPVPALQGASAPTQFPPAPHPGALGVLQPHDAQQTWSEQDLC